jgi:hypothetical protein
MSQHDRHTIDFFARLFEKIISTPALILTGRVYLVENLYSNKGKHLNSTIIF